MPTKSEYSHAPCHFFNHTHKRHFVSGRISANIFTQHSVKPLLSTTLPIVPPDCLLYICHIGCFAGGGGMGGSGMGGGGPAMRGGRGLGAARAAGAGGLAAMAASRLGGLGLSGAPRSIFSLSATLVGVLIYFVVSDQMSDHFSSRITPCTGSSSTGDSDSSSGGTSASIVSSSGSGGVGSGSRSRLTSCPSCRKPLPHCALCLLPMTVAPPSGSSSSSSASAAPASSHASSPDHRGYGGKSSSAAALAARRTHDSDGHMLIPAPRFDSDDDDDNEYTRGGSESGSSTDDDGLNSDNEGDSNTPLGHWHHRHGGRTGRRRRRGGGDDATASVAVDRKSTHAFAQARVGCGPAWHHKQQVLQFIFFIQRPKIFESRIRMESYCFHQQMGEPCSHHAFFTPFC